MATYKPKFYGEFPKPGQQLSALADLGWHRDGRSPWPTYQAAMKAARQVHDDTGKATMVTKRRNNLGWRSANRWTYSVWSR